MRTFEICTDQREKLVNITRQVAEIVLSDSSACRACLVYCPHTTAGLTVNENADPAVATDMKQAMGELVANEGPWEHLEGNSPAHVKSSLMGCSVIVPVVEGELQLGRWQGIFLCEFDGPRTREVWVQLLS